MTFEQLREVRAFERWAAGEHLEHHAAQRVEIGFAADLPVADDLFRRHVGVGANGLSRVRDIRHPEIAGDAEIAKFNLAILRDKQIRRFQVAMDDAIVVGVLQGRRHLPRDGDRFLPGQSAGIFENVFECGSIDQLHHIEKLTIAFAAAVIGDDVGVRQLLQNNHFALELLKRWFCRWKPPTSKS